MITIVNLMHPAFGKQIIVKLKRGSFFWRVLEGMQGIPGPQCQEPLHAGNAFCLCLCNKPDADTKQATDWR